MADARHALSAGRLAAICGMVAIAGNVVAVLLLGEMPSAYRVARLDEWSRAVVEQPQVSALSSLAFTVGLLALALWALHLGRCAEGPGAGAGGFIVSTTSIINAAGTLTPLVLAYHVSSSEGKPAVAQALLGLTLSFDALFNLGLALGFLLIATGTQVSRLGRGWLVVAGLAALPVAGQAIWDAAADALYVAAPFWLSFILFSSVAFWRNRAI